MAEPVIDFDALIYDEMMVHPVLFTHPKAHTMALICDKDNQLTQEILKHPQVRELCVISGVTASHKNNDPRLTRHTGDGASWLRTATPGTWDIIIIASAEGMRGTPEQFQQYYHLLEQDGILVCECDSLFAPDRFKTLYQTIQAAGFEDLHALHFPQPSLPFGSRTAIMANKHGAFKRVREKEVFNKPFATRYYNFDMHHAALALPQFMREALSLET